MVFGDLGTSPLYVFYNTFPHGVDDPEDIIGALSLIIYSLTLIPLLKYVFIVLRANDNGQGKFLLQSPFFFFFKFFLIHSSYQLSEASFHHSIKVLATIILCINCICYLPKHLSSSQLMGNVQIYSISYSVNKKLLLFMLQAVRLLFIHYCAGMQK